MIPWTNWGALRGFSFLLCESRSIWMTRCRFLSHLREQSTMSRGLRWQFERSILWIRVLLLLYPTDEIPPFSEKKEKCFSLHEDIDELILILC